MSCTDRDHCTCCLYTLISHCFPAVFVHAVISVRWARLHVADGSTVSLSCEATGRVKWVDWQCCAGRGWETLSHYERVPAQCSALLKKYTESHMLETLHSCSCKVSRASEFYYNSQKSCSSRRVSSKDVIPWKSHLVRQFVSMCNTVMVMVASMGSYPVYIWGKS